MHVHLHIHKHKTFFYAIRKFYFVISINHELKSVDKVDLQSIHKQKHNITKASRSPHTSQKHL